MNNVTRIETDAPFTAFGKMADLAHEWERDGLGTWLVFEVPNPKQGVQIAVPKHDIENVGCSVFFQHAVDETGAMAMAKKLTELYRLDNPRWMTSDGVALNIK